MMTISDGGNNVKNGDSVNEFKYPVKAKPALPLYVYLQRPDNGQWLVAA